MKHTEFFAAVKSGRIAPCYLFEGDEEYTKKSALAALRNAVAAGDFAEMNDSRLTDPAPDALIAAAETLPFLSDRRLVEIRDSAMLLSGKARDYDEDAGVKRLTEYFEDLPGTTCMVFYVRGKADARKKLTQLLKKKAVCVSFDPLDDRELTRWIASTLNKTGKKISGDTCQRLWFSAGRDLTLLNNELEKLSAYAGERQEITDQDVDAVSVRSTEFKVYDLADTLLSGQGAKALGMLETLLRDGEDRLGLLPLLGRQCRQLKYYRALTAAGCRDEQIMAKLGIPFFVLKKYREMARAYTQEQLEQMAALCLETEYMVKSGRMMDVGSLENVMLRIMAMRGN